jgi:hypothetical protein
MTEGMDFKPEVRELFRGLIFLEIKKAESNTPPGISLKVLHSAFNGHYRDAYGTPTQMHEELQITVAEGLISEKPKDFYRVVAGANPPRQLVRPRHGLKLAQFEVRLPFLSPDKSHYRTSGNPCRDLSG